RSLVWRPPVLHAAGGRTATRRRPFTSVLPAPSAAQARAIARQALAGSQGACIVRARDARSVWIERRVRAGTGAYPRQNIIARSAECWTRSRRPEEKCYNRRRAGGQDFPGVSRVIRLRVFNSYLVFSSACSFSQVPIFFFVSKFLKSLSLFWDNCKI